MRKRILILEQQSHRGGAQRVLDVVLDSLNPEFEPLVVLPRAGPYLDSLRQRGVETRIMPLGEYRPGKKPISEMIEFGPRSVYCGLKLASLIRRRGISLVYVNGPRWLLGGTLAARLASCPSLFHLHLVLSRKSELLLASRAARHITRIIACSRAAAVSLAGTSPGLNAKTTVLYNPLTGFAEENPSPAPSGSREFVVGIVGRVTQAKGHDVLLRAMAKARLGGRKITLLVVGDPLPGCPEDQSYLRSLNSLASELGLPGRIIWAGHQGNPSPYYSAMDVLAFPSTGEEGLGLVLLEAMSRGVPVIASRVGGVPEVVEDGVNGLLVPAGDVPALTAALDRVVAGAGLLRKMGEAARLSIDDRFSLHTFRQKIRNHVNELCSTGPVFNAVPQCEEVAGWK